MILQSKEWLELTFSISQ